jgi:hypothetical protein
VHDARTKEASVTPNPHHDLAAYLETALTEVCFGREEEHPLQATVDRYFTADYQQRTDGELADRDGFAAHIQAVRGLAAAGRIEVLEAVRDGSRIADRHRVTVTKRDGTVSELEVYLFGELAADGRLCRVEEISRVVRGDRGDATLARTR